MPRPHDFTFNKVRQPLIDWLTTYIKVMENHHSEFITKTEIGNAMYNAAILHRRLLWGWRPTTNINLNVKIMEDYYQSHVEEENSFLIRKTNEWFLLEQHLHLINVVCGRLIGDRYYGT